MDEWASLGPLVDSARDAPEAMRWLVGACGLLLMVAGSRVYGWALFGSAAMLGSVGGAALMVLVGEWVPGAANAISLAIGGLVGGVLALGIVRAAHKAALVGVGGLLGAAVGSALATLLGGAWWGPLAGVVVGAMAMPFVFPVLLKVVTPAIGAVGVAWAAQVPDNVWVIAGCWLAGTLIQLGLMRSAPADDSEE